MQEELKGAFFMNEYKVFAINPGSTSTKIALFQGGECIFSKNINHDAAELAQFEDIPEQLPYRKAVILEELSKQGIVLENTDAFVGRGGGLVGIAGGTYKVNDRILEHARTCHSGKHPATLGSQLAYTFMCEYGGESFVVNPPDVDEFCDYARMTGLKGIYRESRIHALNQKEIGIRYADSINKKYDELNLVIAHIGGGISITAHQQGKMIDSNDILNGDGPMAPTRCGTIPVRDIIEMCYSGRYTKNEMKDKLTKSGGMVDHLGTSDVLEVCDRIEKGDQYAKLIFDTLIYQIIKTIGSMGAILKGQVDVILLTGGISRNQYLTDCITEATTFIAPVEVMPGEFEMEALANGAVRVLSGIEEARTYTGIPVWSGFDFID